MIYRAFSSDSNKLVSLPETGMGYQLVQAFIIGQQSIKQFVVYNSELFVDLDKDFDYNRRTIFTTGYKKIFEDSSFLFIESGTLGLIDKFSISEGRLKNYSYKELSGSRYSGGKGAKDNPKESANGKEIFVRLSAYEDDKRIDFERKRLKNGTYTTTLDDYIKCFKTNDDPVDRYALPNDETIKWSFYVKPISTDTLQRGIVQPVFNHIGGGIEIYFENGTFQGTYLGKFEYGKFRQVE